MTPEQTDHDFGQGKDDVDELEPQLEPHEGRTRGLRVAVLIFVAAGLAVLGVIRELSPSWTTAQAQQNLEETAENDNGLSSVPTEAENPPMLSDQMANGPDDENVATKIAKPEITKPPATETDQIAGLKDLIEQHCGARPESVTSGEIALTAKLRLNPDQQTCLDDVALQFDRQHPGSMKVLFDVSAAVAERNVPILQVSTIHSGVLPYINLRDGRTLFVGAIVDGWELASIDDDGAEFRRGPRTFKLLINGTEEAL